MYFRIVSYAATARLSENIGPKLLWTFVLHWDKGRVAARGDTYKSRDATVAACNRISREMRADVIDTIIYFGHKGWEIT